MDRVQPLECQLHAQAFVEKTDLVKVKDSGIKDEVIFSPLRLYDGEIALDELTFSGGEESPFRHNFPIPTPRVIVTMEGDPLDHFPVPNFDNLWGVTTFHMNYTGKSMCTILSSSGEVFFKGLYPRTVFCQSCQAEVLENKVEVVEWKTSDLMMVLRYTTPAYQICYEEETTHVDILEPDGNLMATITQKKTWMNARISRDVMIQPGNFGKANTYKAEFNWNDTTVDFKTTRSGLVVATLSKSFSDKNTATAYTLEILRDVKPRDKAVLVGFMMARDLLMIDEMQTRAIVDKMTAIIVFIFIFFVVLYFFI